MRSVSMVDFLGHLLEDRLLRNCTPQHFAPPREYLDRMVKVNLAFGNAEHPILVVPLIPWHKHPFDGDR